MSMTKIATVTVGAGGASSIDFTSIPGTMTDLMLVISGRSTGTPGNQFDFCKIAFNGSTVDFTERSLGGNGASVYSFTSPGNYLGEIPSSQATANTFSSVSAIIPNYAGSTNKAFSADGVSEHNGTGAQSNISAGLWSQTAAITSISVTTNTGIWAQYSTATLYGIKKGSLAGVTVS